MKGAGRTPGREWGKQSERRRAPLTLLVMFFFSSRRRHTRLQGDWSSDVCSSDLLLMDCDTTGVEPDFALIKFKKLAGGGSFKIVNQSEPRALKKLGYTAAQVQAIRSEERRVGKECRSRWSPYH